MEKKIKINTIKCEKIHFQTASHEARLKTTATGVHGSSRSKQSPQRNTETLEQKVRKHWANASPWTVIRLVTMSNAQHLMASLWKANKVDCSTVRNYSAMNRRGKKITTTHDTYIY